MSDPTRCEFCSHREHDPGSCLDEEACGCAVHTDTALAFVRRVDPDLFRAATLAERETLDVDRLREAARRAGLPHDVSIADIENLAREYAAIAETPEGEPEHPLFDGYCPKCGGSCLVGFGNP